MPYSVGIWSVKAGHEEDFTALWQAMSDWAATVFAGAHGRLLRDRDRPGRFISFGEWPDEADLTAWRARPEFGEYVGKMREHLDDFMPGTFDVVSDG